ncbi:MAG: hypothetical protein HND57_12730 [Planctomycetes bacterium]|nr:hypothetical protein [Planctomycetota bacterium]
MNRLHYWIIVVGVVCVGINVDVNNWELFPTCFGYAMIGIAVWNLRDEDVIFKYASIPAALLALLALPVFLKGGMPLGAEESPAFAAYDSIVFYPYTVMHILLFAGIAAAIARLASRWNEEPLCRLAITAGACAVLFEIPRFFLPFPSRPYYVAFFLCTSLSMLLVGISAATAARKFP